MDAFEGVLLAALVACLVLVAFLAAPMVLGGGAPAPAVAPAVVPAPRAAPPVFKTMPVVSAPPVFKTMPVVMAPPLPLPEPERVSGVGAAVASLPPGAAARYRPLEGAPLPAIDLRYGIEQPTADAVKWCDAYRDCVGVVFNAGGAAAAPPTGPTLAPGKAVAVFGPSPNSTWPAGWSAASGRPAGLVLLRSQN